MEEGEGADKGGNLEEDRRGAQSVGDFKEAGNGVLLEVLDTGFLVGEGLEDIFEGEDLDGRKTLFSKPPSLGQR